MTSVLRGGKPRCMVILKGFSNLSLLFLYSCLIHRLQVGSLFEVSAAILNWIIWIFVFSRPQNVGWGEYMTSIIILLNTPLGEFQWNITPSEYIRPGNILSNFPSRGSINDTSYQNLEHWKKVYFQSSRLLQLSYPAHKYKCQRHRNQVIIGRRHSWGWKTQETSQQFLLLLGARAPLPPLLMLLNMVQKEIMSCKEEHYLSWHMLRNAPCWVTCFILKQTLVIIIYNSLCASVEQH